MKQERLKVALIGNFGTGNLGNDGSLKAMLDILQRVRPDAKLTCICPGHETVERVYQISALPVDLPLSTTKEITTKRGILSKVSTKLFDLIRAVLLAREFDVMIVPGTSLFLGTGIRTGGWPYALFRWFIGARLSGARILIVCTGAGPIPSRASRWLLRSAARMAHYRSYRDTVSKKSMKAHGLDVRGDHVFPDIAFSLPKPAAARQLKQSSITVGIGVMSYEGWLVHSETGAAVYNSYILKLSHFVRWLMNRGHNIRLLIGEITDRTAIRDLLSSVDGPAERFPSERMTVDYADSLDELMHQMKELDIVLATRFHNIVCALKMGIPTISIGYAPKHDALLSEMGLSGFCQNIETLDVDRLTKQFDQLVAGHKHYSMAIAQSCHQHEILLRHQEELFRRALR